MLRKISRSLFARIAAIAVTGIALASQRSPAQSVAPPVAAPAELRALRQLPATAVERARIADLATALIPSTAPAYLLHTFHSSLLAPPFKPGPRRFVHVPQAPPLRSICGPDHIYSRGAFPSVVRQRESDADPAGCEGTFLPNGPVTASTDAFFEKLGTNGRTCATCHQPPTGMSVSTANIMARLQATHGTDPIFAGIDGANCPSKLPPFTGSGVAFKAAHSLLLQRGLFRIFLPLPAGAEFSVSAAGHDPYGCNTTAPFDQDTTNGQTVQMVSAYRRPRMSGNLNFILASVPPPGVPSAPGIMWDTREPTLESQADDATFGHGHAQGLTHLTPAEIAQIVKFETTLFSAQSTDSVAHLLDASGAKGGPVALSAATPGQGGPPTNVTFDEYDPWASLAGGSVNNRRASIARGEKLFNSRTFTISDVAGVNDAPGVPSPLVGTCSGCHSQRHAGDDIFGKIAALDIGVGGASVGHNGPPPSPALPIFTVTCTAGKSTPFNGSTLTTNDLGLAMITGHCADIGKFLVPQLRALSSQPPYFHDGSASTLAGVVGFYNKRFSIGLTSQERQDLINFLDAL